jgi:hypothetical protein
MKTTKNRNKKRIGGKKTIKKSTKMINSSKNTKTKKDLEKDCMESFAKRKMDMFRKETNDSIKKLESTKPMTDELKKNILYLKNNLKNNSKIEEMLSNEIKIQNCNIGCAGTILESGDPNKLPKEYAKKYKGYPEDLIKNLEKSRKELFGTKTSVLDDDSFYDKLNKKIKNKYVKEGAVSYCSIYK